MCRNYFNLFTFLDNIIFLIKNYDNSIGFIKKFHCFKQAIYFNILLKLFKVIPLFIRLISCKSENK